MQYVKNRKSYSFLRMYGMHVELLEMKRGSLRLLQNGLCKPMAEMNKISKKFVFDCSVIISVFAIIFYAGLTMNHAAERKNF